MEGTVMIWSRAATLAVVILLLGSSVAAAAAETDASPRPSSVATPTPSATSDPLGDFTHRPGTGAAEGLDWQPADGPALEAGTTLSRLTAWTGGFAVVERWRDEERRLHDAVLTSADGRSWERVALPEPMRQVIWLLPFRDGLVLVSGPHRGSPRDRFSLDVWRSPDGAIWRRLGSVAASLPRRLKKDPYWRLAPMEFTATEKGLVLLASVRYSVGSGGSVRDATVFVSGKVRAPVRQDLHPDRIWAWTSMGGSQWTRRPVEGVLAPNGHGSVELATPAGGRVIARRSVGAEALLSSRDGVRWRVRSPLPSDFEWGGSEALLWTDGAPLLLSDSSKLKGNEGCGNRLGAWRLDEDGTWVETLDRQPAFVHGAAADGATVLIAGKSWCAGEWAWIIGSADGGRTWDPEVSWTGPLGSCRGEVAITDGIAVVVDCADEQVLLWAALPSTSASDGG